MPRTGLKCVPRSGACCAGALSRLLLAAAMMRLRQHWEVRALHRFPRPGAMGRRSTGSGELA